MLSGIFVAIWLAGCSSLPQAAADCGSDAMAGRTLVALVGGTDAPGVDCSIARPMAGSPVGEAAPPEEPVGSQPPYDLLPRLFVPSG
jgi:hypothetical protein